MFENLEIDIWFILLLFTGILLLIQLFYFFFFYLKLARYKERSTKVELEPVSVIIAARNEERNLMEFLPLIFKQNHPDFQVVVVNDRSWDGSLDVLKAFKKTEPRLHIVNIQDNDLYTHGKKMAITLGIKGAKNDLLVFTDADCFPNSDNWLKEMSIQAESKELLLAYSPYKKRRGFLNRLIRFETFITGVNYLSFALKGIPYMGVGRNMAYRKDLFFKHHGFKSHYQIASGDDDLFVNQVASKKNTEVTLNQESFTTSLPKTSLKKWWNQKRRHYSTGPHYKFKHKLLLSVFPISWLLILIISSVLLVMMKFWIVALALLGARITIQLLIFSSITKKMACRDMLFLTPILEIVFLVINPLIHLSNSFVKTNKWN